MTIVVPLLPTPLPNRLDPASFSDRADATLAQFNPTLVALNNQNAENNLLNQQVQANADLVGGATGAILAVAGYAGVWSTLTGALNTPASVLHNNRVWMLVSNLADVTAQEPTGLSPYWKDVTPISVFGGHMEGDLSVPSLNGGPLAGKRNHLINGRFTVNQNQPSEFQIIRPADNWKVAWSHTVSPSVAEVVNFGTDKRLHVVRSAAATATGAFQYCHIMTALEGSDLRGMHSADFCLSFKARTTKAGTYSVVLRNSNATLSRVFEYTLTADTDTVVVIPIPSMLPTYPEIQLLDLAAPEFSLDSASVQLSISWALAAGSSLRGGSDVWAGGSQPFAGLNQTDAFFASGTSAEFWLTDVQLEPGLRATPPEHEDYVQTLQRCQRYYKVLGALVGVTTSTTAFNGMGVSLPFPMRASPQAFLRNPGAAALHDPGVAFRDITSISFNGNEYGGIISGVCATTTNSKVHNIMNDKVVLAALLH